MALVLVIDDDPVLSELYNAYFSIEGLTDWHAHAETDLNAALAVIKSSTPAIVFLDNKLPPFQDFREPLQKILASNYPGPVIVQSACLDNDVFAMAEKLGAKCVLEKWRVTSGRLAEIVKQYTFRQE